MTLPPDSLPSDSSAASAPPPGNPRTALLAWRTACVSLSLLIVLMTAWELWLAPLRPGGSWLVLKVLPLLLALPGVLKRRLYTFQWTSLLIVIYLGEGAVRVASDPDATSRALAGLELLLVGVLFGALLTYARPYKQAFKARKKAAEKLARDAA